MSAPSLCDSCHENPAEYVMTTIADGTTIYICGSCRTIGGLGEALATMDPEQLQQALEGFAQAWQLPAQEDGAAQARPKRVRRQKADQEQAPEPNPGLEEAAPAADDA